MQSLPQIRQDIDLQHLELTGRCRPAILPQPRLWEPFWIKEQQVYAGHPKGLVKLVLLGLTAVVRCLWPALVTLQKRIEAAEKRLIRICPWTN